LPRVPLDGRHPATTGAAVLTVVVALALLLPGFGSVWAAETLAALATAPPAVGTTTIVAVALSPLGRAASVHVTVLPAAQLIRGDDTDLNVTPDGSVSLSTMSVARSGPLLVATRV